MGKKLYVGNMGYNVSKEDLEKMFAAHGTVTSVQVITDRDSGRSKGFGFVEMGSEQEAQAAIEALNGKSLDGRSLTVNEARPMVKREFGDRPSRGGSTRNRACSNCWNRGRSSATRTRSSCTWRSRRCAR